MAGKTKEGSVLKGFRKSPTGDVVLDAAVHAGKSDLEEVAGRPWRS